MGRRPVSQLGDFLMGLFPKGRQIAVEGSSLFRHVKPDNVPLDIVARVAGDRDDDELIAAIEVVRELVHGREFVSHGFRIDAGADV
jgi:hypothetical protein